MGDANWDICFICQVSSKDNIHSSTGSYKTLTKNIPEFQSKAKLGFHFERICNTNSELLSVLTANKTVHHHNCFSKYSDLKLKRLNEPSKKWKSTEDEKG